MMCTLIPILMAVPSFYTPDLNSAMTELMLPQEEAAHAIKSRRLGPGQAIRLFNGRGLVCAAEIISVERRNVSVSVSDFVQHQPIETSLVVAAAVPKGDRQKVMVDALSQLGVKQIQPLLCAHSVTRFNDKMRAKWQRWAIEACKQSQNPWLPNIADQCDPTQLMDSVSNIVFTDISGHSLASTVKEFDQTSESNKNDLIALIGPEGGFSKEEMQLFSENECKPVRLALHILRTEAAAIALASQWTQRLI